MSQTGRRYTLFVLVIVYASPHLDRNIMGILAESIRVDLGLLDSQLGAMTGFAFAAFYATLGMPMAMWPIATIVAISLQSRSPSGAR